MRRRVGRAPGPKPRVDPVRLTQMWNAGRPVAEIAAAFKVNRERVYAWRQRLELTLRHPEMRRQPKVWARATCLVCGYRMGETGHPRCQELPTQKAS